MVRTTEGVDVSTTVATQVHIVATMIHDKYLGITKMHRHLEGGDVEHIAKMRHTPEHKNFKDSGYEFISGPLNWPMVDLWARIHVDADGWYESPMRQARRARNESGEEYDYANGSVGW